MGTIKKGGTDELISGEWLAIGHDTYLGYMVVNHLIEWARFVHSSHSMGKLLGMKQHCCQL